MNGVTVSPISILFPFDKIAVQGSKVVYQAIFRNGYAPVTATTKFILATSGTGFTYDANPVCDTQRMRDATPAEAAVAVPPAAGYLLPITGEETVYCTFSYTIVQADKDRGKTPDITVKVQLLSAGSSQAQDVATATYAGVPVLSTPVVRAVMDNLNEATSGM